MKIDRVLLVYKKSLYRLYVQEHREASVRRALRRKDPAAQRMLQSHRVQETAMATVERTLKKRGVSFRLCWRGGLRSTRGYDVVIAAGGDGTVLDTAHRIRDNTPLLGINSDPTSSIGKLCAGVAEDLDRLLLQLRRGDLRSAKLTRLRVRIDGNAVLGPCLNDVLFAHRSPAEMSRLQMATVSREEAEAEGWSPFKGQFVRSSGVWVCTATGSPAAMRSAGGVLMPPRSRRLQYLVRETYVPPHHPRLRPLHGFLDADHALVVVNRMRSARLWGDGVHRRAVIHYGQKMVIDVHPVPLHLVTGV